MHPIYLDAPPAKQASRPICINARRLKISKAQNSWRPTPDSAADVNT